jgi:hypothetical protein
MSGIVKELQSILLDHATRVKDEYERGFMKELRCDDVPGALVYGRKQGLEMASDLLCEPRALTALALVPHPPEGGKEAGDEDFTDEELRQMSEDYGCGAGGITKADADRRAAFEASPIPARDTARATEDIEERREHIIETIVAPDNGTVEEVLTAVLHCANAWVPEARIVGNVRAGDISRAVSAALTAPVRAAEVKVKPLEWDDAIHGGWVALGAAGVYHVNKIYDLDYASGVRGFDFSNPFNHDSPMFSTAAEAKAAAEADYEARILAALSLSPGTGEKDRIAELEGALEPFVKAFEVRRDSYSKRHADRDLGYANFDKMPDDWMMEKIAFNMGVFRHARAALTDNKEG